MESANSGSLQSSSGGDEEYDSRAESIAAFLNAPAPPQQQNHAPSLFDSNLTNYFDPPQIPNPSSFLNLDIDWSKSLRSDPNCTPDISVSTAVAPPSDSSAAHRCGGGLFLQNSSTPPPTAQPAHPPHPQPSENAPRGSASAAAEQAATTPGVRNPKKRSRASRRAPTTVLTTDTTNFRAMVQEFTGIPAPPFTAASHPFPRGRLDLFGPPSSIRSAPFGSGDSGTAPYSLLRPFAQKLHHPQQQQQPPPPLAFIPTSANTDSNTTPFHFEMHQQHPQPHHHQNLNLFHMQNLQNPILTFQSLLQTQATQTAPPPPPPPKFPLGNINNDNNNNHLGLGSLEIPAGNNHSSPSSSSHLNNKAVGVLEEFGLGPAQVHYSDRSNRNNNHMVASSGDGTAPPRGGEISGVLPASWGDGGGGGRSNGGDHHSVDGNGRYVDLQRSVSNGKLDNYHHQTPPPASATSPDFVSDHRHNRKPSPENIVSTRSEGMVESWICSSD